MQNLADAGCFNFGSELFNISYRATAEAGAEAILQKVEGAWKDLELNVVQLHDTKDVFILSKLDEVNLGNILVTW